MFFVKTPFWLKKVFKNYVWSISTKEKVIYLTFDDGPHPKATPFVLEQLDKYNAKATFFCIGKNIVLYPDVYQKVIDNGHTVGNHTHNHLNGWKTDLNTYLTNIDKASKLISSKLFRPPYGRIKRQQGRELRERGFKIIMWEVLSGDFDRTLSGEKCFRNIAENAGKGSIIVFHDSEKAFSNLNYSLPPVLEYFSKQGYIFKGISDIF